MKTLSKDSTLNEGAQIAVRSIRRAKRPVISDGDAAHLKWCGFLGHPFVVLYDADGSVHTHGECNDVETAVSWAKERAAQNGRVFNQYKASKYRPVVFK